MVYWPLYCTIKDFWHKSIHFLHYFIFMRWYNICWYKFSPQSLQLLAKRQDILGLKRCPGHVLTKEIDGWRVYVQTPGIYNIYANIIRSESSSRTHFVGGSVSLYVCIYVCNSLAHLPPPSLPSPHVLDALPKALHEIKLDVFFYSIH